MDIESLRQLALSLPDVSEDVKWKTDLCFSIFGKMFCVIVLDQPVLKVSFKVNPVEFEELIEQPGISPAPYLARHHWIIVTGAESLPDNLWEQHIRKSYDLVRGRAKSRSL